MVYNHRHEQIHATRGALLLTTLRVDSLCLHTRNFAKCRRKIPEMREASLSSEPRKRHTALEWQALIAITNLTCETTVFLASWYVYTSRYVNTINTNTIHNNSAHRCSTCAQMAVQFKSNFT